MFSQFSHGPKVRVVLEFEALQFKRASLSFSGHFECQIQGDAEHRQADLLMSFIQNYSEKRPFPLELDLEHLSAFRKKALKQLQKVPFGEVVTYGELAALIDSPKASRAIGMACHHNPYPIFIPCHRVIASGKKLGGFACDSRIKQMLLDFEKS
jgi:O-6-methylguanine DNA methyltransferase